MRVPNPDRAVIDSSKLRDYILSDAHPVGRFKARFFHRLGYTAADAARLEQDLYHHLQQHDAVLGDTTQYGAKYLVRGIVTGPNGRSAEVVSVWIIRTAEDFPRLITAYPGAET